MNAGPPLDTLVLCILDGWGIGQGDPHTTGDAIRLASELGKTPHWDKLCKECLMGQLQTSGFSVGLPDGQMGNSEVGHTHIGAGRIVKQSLTRINDAIASGEFFRNEGLEAFVTAFKKKETQGVVHVAGIVSSGGVHGSSQHVLATLRFFHERGLKVRLHAFLDGRDTKPRAAIEELPCFLDECEKLGLGENVLASVVGRYYAMDRDRRWERTMRAFLVMALGTREFRLNDKVFGLWERIDGSRKSLKEALLRSYENGEDDEFVQPLVCVDYAGFAEEDALFFTNFRDDRTRQLAAASIAEKWSSFSRGNDYKSPYPAGSMTSYGGGTAFEDFYVAFDKESMEKGLGELVSKAGLKQLRIAETEKFAHVTYFFNGGREEKIKGEKWYLIPSPQVATYDQEPKMSANQVEGRFILNFPQEIFSLFVLNFANPDMVGHTGDLEATIEAIAKVDQCLGALDFAISTFSKKAGLMIFADHGNAEQMRDENGEPHTAHTTNPVPLVVVGSPSAQLDKDSFNLSHGSLIDIAPTALHLLGLKQPAVMSGRSLLTKK